MEKLATVSKTWLVDRGIRKIRLNVIGKNNMVGCIVPYDR